MEKTLKVMLEVMEAEGYSYFYFTKDEDGDDVLIPKSLCTILQFTFGQEVECRNNDGVVLERTWYICKGIVGHWVTFSNPITGNEPNRVVSINNITMIEDVRPIPAKPTQRERIADIISTVITKVENKEVLLVDKIIDAILEEGKNE